MTVAPHILVVDDDREIRSLLGDFLTQHGYRVSLAADGRQMQRLMAGNRFDLVILDVMLPGEDGLSLCRKLTADSGIPIIMLTAMTAPTDRIVGLEMGADDYVAKPFEPRELLARIKAVLRRAAGKGQAPAKAAQTYVFDGWRFDVARRVLISPNGVDVALSTGEYELLHAFVRSPQRVLNRDELLERARGRVAHLFDRSMDVQVSRLRRKLERDPANPAMIKTVRNGGYIFTPVVQEIAAEAAP
jgi:two-component system OmpR family response regulator